MVHGLIVFVSFLVAAGRKVHSGRKYRDEGINGLRYEMCMWIPEFLNTGLVRFPMNSHYETPVDFLCTKTNLYLFLFTG